MNAISQMKLGTRLAAAFAAVLFLTLALGGMAYRELSVISADTKEVATVLLPSIKALAKVRVVANQFRRVEGDHVLAVDEKEFDPIEKAMAEDRARLNEAIAEYEPLVQAGEERRLFDQFRKHMDAFFAVSAKLVALSRGGEKTMAQTKELFRGESRESFNAMVADLGALVEVNDKASKEEWATAQATYDQARILIVAIALAAVVVGALLAVLITRGVVRQLGGEPGQAADLARAVADGDLTARIELRAGDTASMMAALKGMQASLTDVVSKVRANSEMVATASGQIAQGTMDLSSRTEEQASALEETSASMQQLGQTVRQNADNARQANQLAQSATCVAVKGG